MTLMTPAGKPAARKTASLASVEVKASDAPRAYGVVPSPLLDRAFGPGDTS